MAKITSPAPGAGRGQARPAVSPALLAALAGRLTARDRWLLRMLLEHRVLTTTQVCDLAYGGPRRAALRLSELYRLRAVDRFRPLAATGSSPYHWVLDQAGAEVLAAEDGVPVARLGYRRDRALDIAFSPRLAHTSGGQRLVRRARPRRPPRRRRAGLLVVRTALRRAVGRLRPPRRIRPVARPRRRRAPTSSSSTTPAAKTCPAWPRSSPGTASWRTGRRSPPRSCSGWPPAPAASSSSAPCSPRPGRSPASRWPPPPPPRPRPPAARPGRRGCPPGSPAPGCGPGR